MTATAALFNSPLVGMRGDHRCLRQKTTALKIKLMHEVVARRKNERLSVNDMGLR